MNEALEQLKSMRELVDELLSLGNVDYKYAKRYENEWLEKAPQQLAEKIDEAIYLIEQHTEQAAIQLNAELEGRYETSIAV